MAPSFECPGAPRADVLVVDDDAGVRDVCRSLLHALGYRTAEASSGEHAIAAIGDGDPGVQLVLLDLEMPGMRGDEVLRALKVRAPGVRVLLMSGHVRTDLGACLACGADGLLRKPFGMRALDSSLAAALGS